MSEMTIGDGFSIGILAAIGAALLIRLGRMMVVPNAVSSSFPVLGDCGPLDTTWGFHLAFLGFAGINVAAYFWCRPSTNVSPEGEHPRPL
jgi:hypothetical protein